MVRERDHGGLQPRRRGADVKVFEVAERDVRYVVEPILTLSSPSEHYGAHIEVYKRGPRGGPERYVRLGPRMVADTALEALGDLRRAMFADLLPGVRVLMEDATASAPEQSAPLAEESE